MTDISLLPIIIATFVAGGALGALIIWLALHGRIKAQSHMVDTFKALAADTLSQNSTAFLQLAESKLQQTEQAAAASLSQKSAAIDAMVAPVKDTLQRMDEQLRAIEIKREGAYRELAEMVTASRETQIQLRQETSQLLQALRAPTARGRWGELQLQRILEMTGMSVHAQDFTMQQVISDDEGVIRPDFIVALPGDRCVVIDSKVPLAAYLDSVQCSDDATRLVALKSHARQVRDHVKRLGAKAYWEQVANTPEFVVLFMPGEHFLSAAMDGDSELMDYCANQHVVLATPMTLIALLRTIAYGWRQEALRDNVRQIAEMGRKLYNAVGIFAAQMDTLGSKITGTVETYNKTVNAMEKQVLAKARQLSDFGAGSEEALPVLEPIERRPRDLTTLTQETRQDDAA
jgi:DNA recombination protein RmuC